MPRPYKDDHAIAVAIRDVVYARLAPQLNGAKLPTGQTVPGEEAPPPKGDMASYKAWFMDLVKGLPPTSNSLKGLEAQLIARGFKLRPNAAGVYGKIETPEGDVVDVIEAASGPEGGKAWQWLLGSGGYDVMVSAETLAEVTKTVSTISYVSAAWVLRRFRENPAKFRRGDAMLPGYWERTENPATGHPVTSWPNGDGPRINLGAGDHFDIPSQQWVNLLGQPLPHGPGVVHYLPGQGPTVTTTWHPPAPDPAAAGVGSVTRDWTDAEVADLNAAFAEEFPT